MGCRSAGEFEVLKVETQIHAVEIDLTPTSEDSGFTIRIDADWQIVLRNKANGEARIGSVARVLMLMIESKDCETP
jgi:hypothetical protein